MICALGYWNTGTSNSAVMQAPPAFQGAALDVSDLLTEFAKMRPGCTWETLNMPSGKRDTWFTNV